MWKNVEEFHLFCAVAVCARIIFFILQSRRFISCYYFFVFILLFLIHRILYLAWDRKRQSETTTRENSIWALKAKELNMNRWGGRGVCRAEGKENNNNESICWKIIFYYRPKWFMKEEAQSFNANLQAFSFIFWFFFCFCTAPSTNNNNNSNYKKRRNWKINIILFRYPPPSPPTIVVLYSFPSHSTFWNNSLIKTLKNNNNKKNKLI